MNNSRDAERAETAVSRRTVLVGSAVAIGGVVGVTGTASAQTTITGVIDRPRRWEDADLNGFAVEMPGADDEEDGEETAAPAGGEDGDETETGGDAATGGADATDGGVTTTEVPETPDCDFEDWPPDEVEHYEARLVNRKADDAQEEDTTLWVSADADIADDARFLINEHSDCGDGDLVGVALEPFEGGGDGSGGQAEEDVEDFEEGTPAGDGQDEGVGAGTPESGPGFGVLAALAGALGLGGLLARLSGRDD